MPDLSTLQQYTAHVHQFFTGEIGRLAATCLVITAGVAVHRLNLRYVGMTGRRDGNQERSRQRIVATKNLVFLIALMAVGTIWATKIAGVALSLAAFAGAMVLSAKELIMCGTGYLLYTISRPFRVGDYIEVNSIYGRVIDVDMFCTTLAETAPSYQLTGRGVSFPNSLLLSNSVRNQSTTGDFVITMLRVAVPYEVDRDAYEEAALAAGKIVCQPWLDKADEHFRRIEEADFIDLPSSRVKVLWEPHDVKQHWLVLRFATPIGQRVTAQQDILRLFWKNIEKLSSNAEAEPG